jgi:O-antigen/teichoic acid export membrane protein
VLAGTVGFRVVAYGGQALILHSVSKELVGVYRGLVDLHLLSMAFLPLALDSLLVREKLRRRRFAMALSMGLALTGLILFAGLLLGLLLPGPGGDSFVARTFARGDAWPAAWLMLPILGVMATKLSIRSLLSADLDFRRISIGEFGNGLITYFGGAAAVLLYPSVASLMAAYLAGEIFECIYMYSRFRFRLDVLAPRRWGVFTAVWRRHWRFCLTNTADLTINNLGSLIPGPLLVALVSASAAADFHVARMLIQMPILILTGAIWRVAYPTISGVSEAVLQDRVLRITGTSAALLVPGVLWLAFFAPVTAVALGGTKYLSSAPLVMWMAGYMALSACFSPISTLDMIRDKSHWGLWWNIAHTSTRIWIIFHFAQDGLLAVIAAMCVASLLFWIVWAVMLGVLAQTGLGRFFGNVLKFSPLWIAIGVAFGLCNLTAKWSFFLPPVISIIPGLAYLGLVLRFFPAESEMVRRLLRR